LEKLSIRIADTILAIISPVQDMKMKIRGAGHDFLVHTGNSDIALEAKWDDLSLFEISGNKVFDSGSIWQLYQKNGNFLFSFNAPGFGPFPYKVANVKQDFTWGEVLIHRPYFDNQQIIYPLEYPLDELLLMNFLSLGRGVEIHACGMVDTLRNGYLFVGQSGAGKTTLARLLQKQEGITVLSDDRIILRKLDGKFWIYGTPWHGDAGLASPARAPLTRIYFLGRGQENGLMPIRRTAAAAGLFARSFPPFYSREGLDFILGFLGEVANAVPCNELRFTPDERIVEFILMESRK
jgi:hypothetical protein